MTHIEFGLPCGSGGLAAGYHSQYIRKELAKWSREYNVTVKTSVINRDYRSWICVEFAENSDLTLFALTWTAKTFMPWQLAKPAENP